ncbi:MAG: hypothetical protein ACYC9K_11510 [Sulfuricaulis sp.]
MYRYVLPGVLLALMGLSVNGCAVYTATSGRVVLKDDSAPAEVRFHTNDRAQIQNYYRSTASASESSSATRPVRGARLPADVKAAPLPRSLERSLSPLPFDYIRVRTGQDIVLMNRKTRVVLDVIYGVAD